MVNILTDSPISSHTLAQDQPLMEANNKYYAHTLVVDHQIGDATAGLTGNRNDGIAGEGYHNVIHLNTQAMDPAPSSVGQLYSKTIAGSDELFYESIAGIVSQLTGPGGQVLNYNGYAQIGPLLFQWGFVNGTHGANNTFNLGDNGTVTFTIPFPNKIVNVTTCMNWNSTTAGSISSGSAVNAAPDYGKTTNSKFNWQVGGSGSSFTVFYWLAFGF
jgi:hypothetical protein